MMDADSYGADLLYQMLNVLGAAIITGVLDRDHSALAMRQVRPVEPAPRGVRRRSQRFEPSKCLLTGKTIGVEEEDTVNLRLPIFGTRYFAGVTSTTEDHWTV